MNALLIIGTTFAGALVGGVIGAFVGEREGGDYNFAPAIYAPLGALVGGAAGVVIGSAVFAQ